jgi:signal transduction histidine kinase
LPVDLEVNGSSDGAPPGVDLSGYRIIQESLTNVLKHAGPGATAKITVTYGPDDLELTIADTGVGGEAPDGAGHGLIGIRERVAVVGGHVDARPGTDGGFIVTARLPYEVTS